jgi:hypothetical protein
LLFKAKSNREGTQTLQDNSLMITKAESSSSLKSMRPISSNRLKGSSTQMPKTGGFRVVHRARKSLSQRLRPAKKSLTELLQLKKKSVLELMCPGKKSSSKLRHDNESPSTLPEKKSLSKLRPENESHSKPHHDEKISLAKLLSLQKKSELVSPQSPPKLRPGKVYFKRLSSRPALKIAKDEVFKIKSFTSSLIA